MTAEIISVGTELLLGQIVDTHAATMARLLAESGIACVRRQTVGDNFERIVEALNQALGRADLVVTIGGLGPTDDDLTRPAIAAALGDEMLHEDDFEEALRASTKLRGFPWVESNGRQADRPDSARFIENRNGSAPGLICEKAGKTVIALPGPKGEFETMAQGPVLEFLRSRSTGEVIHSRTLRICGLGESFVEERIRPLLTGTNPTVAPYAKTGEVHLRLTARANTRDEADRLIDPIHRRIEGILGDAVYGVDSTTLEDVVVELMRKLGVTLGLAESMTGGALGERLTRVSGVSSVLAGGVIAYRLEAKSALLDIEGKILSEFGPVSREVAEAMARGIRDKLRTTYGIGITGNAGPTSDLDGKPVGLVLIGVAGPDGVEVAEHRFRGERADVRFRAVQSSLVALRTRLLRRNSRDTPS